MGWGIDVHEKEPLLHYQNHWEIYKVGFVSGVVCYELSVVSDYHYVQEWGAEAPHYNVRVRSISDIHGNKIPRQEFPMPTTLTKQHYPLNELSRIFEELFKLKGKLN